jgi:hypothetical protein
MNGDFSTRAKYRSATIRGTAWGIQDRCGGSTTTETTLAAFAAKHPALAKALAARKK